MKPLRAFLVRDGLLCRAEDWRDTLAAYCSSRYVAVDDTTLATIRAEFRELVSSSDGALDAKAVFKQLCADQRVQQRRKEGAGTSVDGVALVNLHAVDGGFGEWFSDHWTAQVTAYN